MSGRPLRGEPHFDGGSWTVTLPRRRGTSPRISASFASEKAARRWSAEQICRLQAGLGAEHPPLGTPVAAPQAGHDR